MLKRIGNILGHAPASSERRAVRRDSHRAGCCEGGFWRRTDRQEMRRVLLAAKRYDLVSRQKGQRNGPLGHVAIEVLELLSNLVSFRTGRLDPSIAYLMERLRRSRDAVVRALKALQSHGFLDRLRRYESTERTEGHGPRVRQVSNAYRLMIPRHGLRLLGVRQHNTPLPDDALQALEERRQALDAQKASLSLDELALLEVKDGSLAGLLAELGRRVQNRESAKQTESQTTLFS